MLTQNDLQQIANVFDKKMDEKLVPIQKNIERLDMKIEAVLEHQKKAHAEIMEKLIESNELNGQEVRKLEKRVDRIEKHLELSHLNNNYLYYKPISTPFE